MSDVIVHAQSSDEDFTSPNKMKIHMLYQMRTRMIQAMIHVARPHDQRVGEEGINTRALARPTCVSMSLKKLVGFCLVI